MYSGLSRVAVLYSQKASALMRMVALRGLNTLPFVVFGANKSGTSLRRSGAVCAASLIFVLAMAPTQKVVANPVPLVIDGEYQGTAVSGRRHNPFWTLHFSVANPRRRRITATVTATRAETGEVIGPVKLRGGLSPRPRTTVFHLDGRWQGKLIRFRGEFGTDATNLPGSPPATMRILSGIYTFASVPDRGTFQATAPLP